MLKLFLRVILPSHKRHSSSIGLHGSRETRVNAVAISLPKLRNLHTEFILCFRSALSDEKRRLDSKISELEEELEEERAQNEMLMEKAKRSQLAVDYLIL